ATFEFLKGREFALISGNDELPAAIVRDAVLLAEAVHEFAAFGAVLRLGRTRLVIETGVNHAAVVPGLVLGDVLFGFDYRNRSAPGEGQRRSEANDPAADDEYIRGVHGVRVVGTLRVPSLLLPKSDGTRSVPTTLKVTSGRR